MELEKLHLIPANRIATHAIDGGVCTAVALGIECAALHKYNADATFAFVAYTQTYGLLHKGFEVFDNLDAGKMIGGYWGEWRIYANVPLSAVYIGLKGK